MALCITHPVTHPEARRYVLDVLLGQWIGVPYQTQTHKYPFTRITRDGASTPQLIVHDDLLGGQKLARFDTSIMPSNLEAMAEVGPLGAASSTLPSQVVAWYGRPNADGKWIWISLDGIEIGIDLFGSAFFMLTRMEEHIIAATDEHGRFRSAASAVVRAGMERRAIVDEWSDLLAAAIGQLWPDLPQRRRQYDVLLTCDVDRPLVAVGRPLGRSLASAVCDVIKRQSFELAWRRGAAGLTQRLHRDPAFTFDALMQLSSKHGLRHAFYFMSGATEPRIDADYSIDDPMIRRLIRAVHECGGEIGIHPSYRTMDDPALLREQVERLRSVCDALGVDCDEPGGRQHYLRWSAKTTWTDWEQAGLAYDSSVGFADRLGLRCGTTRPFTVYDLVGGRMLTLREVPLTAMDVTATSYLGLTDDETVEALSGLARTCRHHGGQMTVLWHNTSVMTARQWRLYQRVIEAILP